MNKCHPPLSVRNDSFMSSHCCNTNRFIVLKALRPFMGGFKLFYYPAYFSSCLFFLIQKGGETNVCRTNAEGVCDSFFGCSNNQRGYFRGSFQTCFFFFYGW